MVFKIFSRETSPKLFTPQLSDLPPAEYLSSYSRSQPFQLNLLEERGQGDGSGEGFIVRGGPWEQQQQAQRRPDTASIEDFPSFGTAYAGEGHTITWGPRPR